jgi:two-component system response regulator HydG
MSKRSDKPFVAVDCGLLSKELAASALFGHEKGAFTGADTKRKGYWEEADGGTLFLDEIGNLSLEVQQMMLRALESKRYRPIGGNKEKTADVRIIAATNEDMQSAVAEKRFRQDLYHRIKEYTLHIPPLPECHENIMPLAEFFRNLPTRSSANR